MIDIIFEFIARAGIGVICGVVTFIILSKEDKNND